MPTGTVLATRRTRISFRPPCRLPLPAERRLLVGEQAPRRPRSKPGIKAVPQSGLLGRLQAFLPTLEAANADLQAQPAEEVAMEHGRCAAGAAAALSAFPAALVVVAEVTAPACRPAGCPHSRSGLVSIRQPQLACSTLHSPCTALPCLSVPACSEDEREGPYVELDLACGLFDLKDDAAVAAAERSLAAGQGVAVEAYDGGSGSSSSSSGDSDSDSEEEAGGREEVVEGTAADAGDAMQEDGAAEGIDVPAAAGPGRRRKGKARHAGIEELS